MKPFSEWTPAEMQLNTAMVTECRAIFGIVAARQLSESWVFRHRLMALARRPE
ncbi:hypothetical protein ACFSDD_10965 [Salipiger marinus]|uniref:hypothetical protein n=1 Tax=Salipiger marinus TaxID=555512 RepID=UPI002C652CE5|nr:hypothetical protein [Salipiger manganoxidans]MEB3419891.1 hypothetical protein [Salipiger manganoxidans]